MMRSHSATFKSRPKNRTRTPKYHHRSTSGLLDATSQSDIENARDRLRNNIFFHHHQHHHNFYLPRLSSSSSTNTNNNNNTPTPNPTCEIKKFLIYAILFFAAYYLLFIGITTTYRHNVYSKNIRTPNIPDRVQISALDTFKNTAPKTQKKPDSEPLYNPLHVSPRQLNPFQSKTDRLNLNPNDFEKTESVTALKNVLANRNHVSSVMAMRRQRRQRHRQEVRKLKPFPQMYISDVPYYLDKNLVIIGQVCDAEKRIDMILYQLESISCLFNSTTFILFESNSQDKTLLHLQRWSLRKPLNCTQIAFKPEHKKKYDGIKSLRELISIYKPDKYERDYIYDYDHADGIIAQYLEQNYKQISDINVYEISEYLHDKLVLDELRQIEIEEILYEKLQAIKYVRYHGQIMQHDNDMYKHVLTGDELVMDELVIEEEILRQLRVYGSLNELHNGYNVMDVKENKLLDDDDYDGELLTDSNGEISAIFMDDRLDINELDMKYNFLSGIRREELKRHSHSDFVQEFGGIHDEIEGLIQYDEAIIHEKLRERKRKYEERRRRERAKREEEILKSQNLIDVISQQLEQKEEVIEQKFKTTETELENKINKIKFRDKLFRIERFVIYRNMLLQKTHELSAEMNILFDYILVIDMDIYSIDIRTFMSELYFMPQGINGLCIDGLDWMGYTRDTFATVKADGNWLHYGHDALTNDSKYIYNNQHAMFQRTKLPNHEENRFEKVKSCFGGIMVYKNFGNELFEQQCKYTLTRDIFYTNYNNSEEFFVDDDDDKTVKLFNYTFEYWLNNRYHNEYSEQSELEIKLFVKQYVELLQVFDKTIENREVIPKDGDICEHIPYHYCLYDKGFKFAISSRAKLYYDKFYPINRNDTNWANYIANRAKFTQ